jgi:hypothetical protein
MRLAAAIPCLACLLSPMIALADDVRDFAPDRPSRSDSPITVPETFVQLESDLVNYTNTGEQFQALDPVLKYGLTTRTDIEVEFGGLQTQRNDGVSATSFGDITVRAKISMLGDDGGSTAIALIPYVKIPTARPPIGNGQVEGGLNAPALFSLPFDLGLTVEPEMAVLKNEFNNGKQASFAGVVNLGRKIIGDLSGFVEIYAQTYTDDRAPGPDVTFDAGLAYAVTKTLQLDAGVNIGLNRATPGVSFYTGVATRF